MNYQNAFYLSSIIYNGLLFIGVITYFILQRIRNKKNQLRFDKSYRVEIIFTSNGNELTRTNNIVDAMEIVQEYVNENVDNTKGDFHYIIRSRDEKTNEWLEYRYEPKPKTL